MSIKNYSHDDEKRIYAVCEYIYQRLSDKLTLEELSQIACFSKYHFHRKFSEYMGISIFRFILLLRLKRASYHLAFKDNVRIIDIAFDAHFESPEAFSRAFKRIFSQTPTQFQRQPAWDSWHRQFKFSLPKGMQDMNVKIVNFPETMLAIKEHRGSPDKIYDSVKIFIDWRKSTKLSPVKTSNTYGVAYDDPEETVPENFRFDICGSVDSVIPENSFGVKSGSLPHARCALIRHKGSHDTISESIKYLFTTWIPSSGEIPNGSPIFFHYLNLIPDVDECDLITDIYLPLMMSID